jgi:hypothetical protein
MGTALYSYGYRFVAIGRLTGLQAPGDVVGYRLMIGDFLCLVFVTSGGTTATLCDFLVHASAFILSFKSSHMCMHKQIFTYISRIE